MVTGLQQPRADENPTSDGTIQLRNSPGIDFSQIQTNASGMTSETLDSYEEGDLDTSLASIWNCRN